jgi:hypothetical protein
MPTPLIGSAVLRLRERRLPDSPWLPAVAAGAAATVYVLLRLLIVAHGDPSRFIIAGRAFATPGAVPRGLHPIAGTGYDGQFYYRIALNPFDFRPTAFGITVDSVFRFQRIGYPMLAWLVVLGHRPFVPEALIALNIAGITMLGWLGGLLARDSRRHALWGLTIAGYFGFVFSLGRDLTEIIAACFAVAGIVALRRRRPGLAGLALAAAALTRETELVVAVAYGLIRVVNLLRRRTRVGRDDLAWVVPGVLFVCWQVLVRLETGLLPIRADSSNNLGLPLTAMFRGIGQNLSHVPQLAGDIWVGELIVLAIVVGYAARVLRSTTAPVHERVAWGLVVVVLVCLSGQIWPNSSDFRAFDEGFVLSWILLLASGRRLGLLAACSSSAWLVVVVHHIAFL